MNSKCKRERQLTFSSQRLRVISKTSSTSLLDSPKELSKWCTFIDHSLLKLMFSVLLPNYLIDLFLNLTLDRETWRDTAVKTESHSSKTHTL